jgi:hypothetical protein
MTHPSGPSRLAALLAIMLLWVPVAHAQLYDTRAQSAYMMEGCTIGDMTAIAVKLARFGMGDEYWEDVDRYVRNCLIESQFTRPDQIENYVRQLREQDKMREQEVERVIAVIRSTLLGG